MTIDLDRRRLVIGASLGAAWLLLPGGTLASAPLLNAKGFTHNVASGEPDAESVLLWTRYVPRSSQESVTITAEVARDPSFAQVVFRGAVQTGPWRDWTTKITATGLIPRTRYWFRFVAPDGSFSLTGRTCTLPDDAASVFRLGVFSCSNLPMGWFNAYGHAAARDDLDLWLHVGDYMYEYGIASYGVQDRIAERLVLPAHDREMVSLLDYRMRLACYRADPDLQRLHQLVPMIGVWDDHESANDSWEGGAQNHQPETEGDWATRKAAAKQAYREWLPVSDEPWKEYRIGRLATLYRTESRLLARTRPAYPALAAAHQAPAPDAALRAFRDGGWQDPAATMLGSAQESWLAKQLAHNARDTAWQLVGMGTIMGRTLMPAEIPGWLKPDTSERVARNFANDVRASSHDLPMWMDRWDGYPAARGRFLKAAQRADADLVMLSGDSHNAWAYSLAHDGQPAGVEFAGHSVSSHGIEGRMGVDPRRVAEAFIRRNPELRWADTSRRGYMTIDLSPHLIRGTWTFMHSIKERTLATTGSHSMSVERGRRAFSA